MQESYALYHLTLEFLIYNLCSSFPSYPQLSLTPSIFGIWALVKGHVSHFVVLPFQFSSVQSLSHVQLFVTPWTAACQASLSITNSHSLLRLMSIELVMPSNHLILSSPLLLPPLIFPSIRIFSSESALHIKWSKYWSFSFNISSTNEHPGLISSRMDWLDLFAVQGTLKGLLQHHGSKASIFRHSAFLIVQLSHLYMTTGKTIALTRQTFVDKQWFSFRTGKVMKELCS